MAYNLSLLYSTNAPDLPISVLGTSFVINDLMDMFSDDTSMLIRGPVGKKKL